MRVRVRIGDSIIYGQMQLAQIDVRSFYDTGSQEPILTYYEVEIEGNGAILELWPGGDWTMEEA